MSEDLQLPAQTDVCTVCCDCKVHNFVDLVLDVHNFVDTEFLVHILVDTSGHRIFWIHLDIVELDPD